MFIYPSRFSLIHLTLATVLACTNSLVIAEQDRADYDLDDNGLIEINDLADLNEIRNNLDGTALYGSSEGCPADGCNGFELTTSLDFDTNSDGQMNGDDDFWNDAEGWLPVGSFYEPFAAIFNGNGHVIRNLFINRNTDYGGLFGVTAGAQLSNLGLTGPLMRISGTMYTGALIGHSKQDEQTTIDSIFSTGVVISSGLNAGGLVGFGYNLSLSNSFSTGSVTESGGDIGGLVGFAGTATAHNSFATGAVSGLDNEGGLAGYAYQATITNSYWATDTTGQADSAASNADNGYLGETLAKLQCPTTADNGDCSDQASYTGWDSNLWSFGGKGQLPGLILNGTVYRDSDGDGSLDQDDVDDDNDGVNDSQDALPLDKTESVDTDNDGIGNNADTDDDGDGVSDSQDAFPLDKTGSSISDDVDTDNNGLIETSSLSALTQMREDLLGTSLATHLKI